MDERITGIETQQPFEELKRVSSFITPELLKGFSDAKAIFARMAEDEKALAQIGIKLHVEADFRGFPNPLLDDI